MHTFDIIIYTDSDRNLSHLKDTLQSLSLQNPLPNNVAVIIDNEDFDAETTYAALAAMELPYKWFVRFMENDLEIPPTVERLLFIIDDIVRGKLRSKFYSIFDAGAVVRKDFLNRLANSDKFYFIVQPYPDGEAAQGFTASNAIHRHFGGHGESNLLNKLATFAKENEIDPRILNFHDV